MKNPGEVLVVGAGVTGMKASLLLAAAGRRIHLVEKTSVTGGNLIRCEDVFTGLECATCMISPMQQEVLRSDLIDVITLAQVTSVQGSRGDYRVTVRQSASCVDPVACIGCGECWAACPVELSNSFEENLSSRKAISVPCAGALPNVPWIDRGTCRRWTGEDTGCSLCAEACVFEAIDYSMEDREIELEVTDIVLAKGFRLPDPEKLESLGWGASPGVYTSMEFERLFASNGPTSGEIVLRDGSIPASAAVIVHADPSGDASFNHVNSLCGLKYAHYLKKKLPDIGVTIISDNLCTPGRNGQRFHDEIIAEGVEIIRLTEVPVVTTGSGGEKITISCPVRTGTNTVETDMLILVPPMLPGQDQDGMPKDLTRSGSALKPVDIAGCTVAAAAAVATILAGRPGRGS